MNIKIRLQITNINNSIPYSNSLTNPNNEQNGTINGTSIKRSGTQSRKKTNNISSNKNIININKNSINNRIPSNYIRGSGISIGLSKNSSCSKITSKKYQNNNNINFNSNKIGINKEGANFITNNGTAQFPPSISNKIFGKNFLGNNINNNI